MGPKDENLREAFDFVTNSSGCVTAHDLLPVVGSIGRETNRQKVQKKLMRIESNLRLESNYRQSGRIKDRVFSYPVFAEYMRQEVSAGKEVCVRIRPGGFKHTALHTKKSVVCESAQESTLFNKVFAFRPHQYGASLTTSVHNRSTTASLAYTHGTFWSHPSFPRRAARFLASSKWQTRLMVHSQSTTCTL